MMLCFRRSIFSYLGVGLGFITVGLLWPKFLEPEQIGLINFLIAISALLAHVGSLGINSVIIRIFPNFRDADTKHNGFLFLALVYISLGSVLVLLYYLLFRERIIANNVEKSALVVQYAYYIVPFTLATLLFNLFDSLHKVMYNGVIGIFLKDFIFRIFNLVLMLVYIWISFRFRLFLDIYFLLFSLPSLVLILMLFRTRQFNLSPNFSFLGKDLKKSIADVSMFGLLGGMGTIAISNIDKIMINHFIDLKATGIYTIAFLFGTIITLPSRPLGKIATTVVAESWKKNDLETIRTIYSKSCLNQFIFAGLIFLLVWLNIDLVFQILPEEYAAGKYVILFVSLAGLVEMATGLNGMIISASRYYRYQSVFIFFLMILVVVTNWIFIPRFGITGAAVASLISTIVYNLVRAGFLYKKFRLQPFNYRFLIIGGAIFVSLFVGHLMQELNSWLIKTVLLCFTVLILYVLPIWLLKISVDINEMVEKSLKTWKGYFHKK